MATLGKLGEETVRQWLKSRKLQPFGEKHEGIFRSYIDQKVKRSCGRSFDEAEDIFHDVFIKTKEAVESFDEPIRKSAIAAFTAIVNLRLINVITETLEKSGKPPPWKPDLPIREEMRDVPGVGLRPVVVVTGVNKGSPEDKAGIKEGDDIVEVSEVPVRYERDLRELLKRSTGQASVRLTIRRHGEPQEVTIVPSPKEIRSIVAEEPEKGLDSIPDGVDVTEQSIRDRAAEVAWAKVRNRKGRRIFKLHHKYGFSYEEISEMLREEGVVNCKIQNLKMKRGRALREFFGHLLCHATQMRAQGQGVLPKVEVEIYGRIENEAKEGLEALKNY